MFRVWTKNLGWVKKSEAHVYFLALTCNEAEQLGKHFLLKGNFIMFSFNQLTKTFNAYVFLYHFSAVTAGFWQNEMLIFLTVGVAITAIGTVACVRYGRKGISGRSLQVVSSASSNCPLPTTSRAKRRSVGSYQSVELFAINKRGWERL